MVLERKYTEQNLEEEFLNNCLDFRNNSSCFIVISKVRKTRLIIHFMSQTDKKIYDLTTLLFFHHQQLTTAISYQQIK